VVNQSQVEQLFDVYEYYKPGENLEDDDPAKGGSKVEDEEEFESDSISSTDEPTSYTRAMREKQTDELFELCEEIQDIVGKVQPGSIMNISTKCTNISSPTDTAATPSDIAITNNSLLHKNNSLVNTDNSMVIRDNTLVNTDTILLINNSLAPITNFKMDTNDSDNEVVEKIYIDVEEESTDNSIEDAVVVTTPASSACNELSIFDSPIEEIKPLENVHKNDLMAAVDLLNEFDYMIDTYGSSMSSDIQLTAESITPKSPNDSLLAGDGWGDDLMGDLFPSLSSL